MPLRGHLFFTLKKIGDKIESSEAFVGLTKTYKGFQVATTFGKRKREKIKREVRSMLDRNLSQTEIAKILDISRCTINGYCKEIAAEEAREDQEQREAAAQVPTEEAIQIAAAAMAQRTINSTITPAELEQQQLEIKSEVLMLFKETLIQLHARAPKMPNKELLHTLSEIWKIVGGGSGDES